MYVEEHSCSILARAEGAAHTIDEVIFVELGAAVDYSRLMGYSMRIGRDHRQISLLAGESCAIVLNIHKVFLVWLSQNISCDFFFLRLL